MASDQYYIIDTCSLTKLRRDYPQAVFPSVWNFMSDLVADRTVESIEIVFDELSVQAGDDVTAWAKERKQMFLPLDEAIQTKARDILSQFSNLIDLKKRKSGADPFVVAAAMVYECTVVTEEKKSGGPNKVKIPDVCEFYNIECITLIELLEQEGLNA